MTVNARFRERIEVLTGRQVQSKSRGGDRISVKNLNHCQSIDTDPIDPVEEAWLIKSVVWSNYPVNTVQLPGL